MAPSNQSVATTITFTTNQRLERIRVAALYAGVDISHKEIEFMDLKTKPEYTSRFPYGRHPVMETEDGPLFEASAMAHYVALKGNNPKILGSTPYEKALIAQFDSIALGDINANAWTLMAQYYHSVPYNKASFTLAVDQIKRAAKVLNQVLSTRTFLVGERVTLADINMVGSLSPLFKEQFDAKFRAEVPHLTRWFLTCVNQPHFKTILGNVVLCAEPRKVEIQKPAVPVAAKKSEKKEAAPKKKEKPQAEEDDTPKEEKKKSVLESLPPSPFVLDAWKRFYSNNDAPEAQKHFWENYDPQGYSMWECAYKYNDELTQVFMSSNLIGGLFSRTERCKKWGFGSMIVAGVANDNAISGMFIFRGQDIPEEFADAADFDSYEFKKLDVTGEVGKVKVSDAIKTKWNAYLAWEGDFGKPFADGKIFK